MPDLTPIKPRVLRWSRKPLTRLQVFAVWAVIITIVCVVSRSEASWRIFEVVSALVLAFFGWPFVDGPYRLYRRGMLPLRADYRIFEGPFTPKIPEYLVRDLSCLGFKSTGRLVQEPGTRNVAAQIELFVHAANKDSAQVGYVMNGLRDIPVLVFKARFEDGFAFETSNTRNAPVFQPDPNFPVCRFPAVRSTKSLYRLHCKIKEQFALTHGLPIADPDGELNEFIHRAEIVRQRHAQSGHYKLASSGDCYVYTLRGAIRHACLSAWPVKPLRASRVYTKSMRMAEELGLRIHPKFGCLEESLRRPDAS